MSIDWEKIQQNPNKSYKTEGVNLLNLKLKIELLEKNISELTAMNEALKSTNHSLEKLYQNQKSEIKEKKGKIFTMEKEIKDLNATLEKTKVDSENFISELKSKHENEINLLNEKLSDLENQILKLNKEIKDNNEKNTILENQNQNLNNELSKLKSEIQNLEIKITQLENLKSQNELELEKLNKQAAENSSKTESTIIELNSKLENLQKVISDKEKSIKEKDEKINELNNKREELNQSIENLNKKIEESNKEIMELRNINQELQNENEELNRKIKNLDTKLDDLKGKMPKKVVYETPEQVIKGSPCPKCGMTTFEEFKMVNGKKKIIRKYCPNSSCGWRSAHRPEATIMMSVEAPKEEKKELKIYWVKKDGLEETKSLNSNIVAIISDPAQNVIWIWKGQHANRFEYAEATHQAIEVKNISGLVHAKTERVEEGNEPANFPDL
ncbi:MAG: hypothetical protein ACTSR3_02910 [Candidatus Helarchaeota archaeon]